MFNIVLLESADCDVSAIVAFIASHSTQGAAIWLDAFQKTLKHLSEFAASCGHIDEQEQFEIPLRQCLFRTRKGNCYRIIFLLDDQTITVLRVRGPGQKSLHPEDLD